MYVDMSLHTRSKNNERKWNLGRDSLKVLGEKNTAQHSSTQERTDEGTKVRRPKSSNETCVVRVGGKRKRNAITEAKRSIKSLACAAA